MDVGAWLEGLGLGEYAEAFAENRIDVGVLPSLTSEDLKEIGVVAVGDRRKLLDAITALSTPDYEPAGEAVEDAGPSSDRRAEAQRRQLTVMFCDLVGSTELSERLDPEDMREVFRAYQDCCAGVIERFEGHIAKFMGDGVLVYFGYPKAHEDEAERAVRAGLSLAEAVGSLAPRTDLRIQARIGIATGLVVVGDLIGEGAAQEEAVVGDTPNLAARLQGLAEPGSVLIAPHTRRLLGGLFELIDLGQQALKGLAEPTRVWRVVGESRTKSRFEARHMGGLTPLVGREQELGLLLDRWRQAVDGDGQVVLLAGEAGIGKSRMLQTLRDRLVDEPHVRLRYYCSPYHVNTALYPMLDQIERGAGFERDDPPNVRLDKLEAVFAQGTHEAGEVTALVATMLSIPSGERYPPQVLSPQRRRARTQELLVEQVVGLAAHRPVLMLFEDAHWSDPTTLELFDLIIDRAQRLPVLIVMTFRPEFVPPWSQYPHITTLSLNRFSRRQSAAMVDRVAGGKKLPTEVLEQIVDKADGVPLFNEELTKAVLESGLLVERDGSYLLAGPLPPLAIPTTLQDSLMARLDRRAPVKEVAQIASVIGREFSHELLAAVARQSDGDLDTALAGLEEAELVFGRGTPPDVIYTFKHALVQDAAYASLLRGRRQQLHATVAQALEERFPDTVEGQPEVLAHHLAAGGLADKAIEYWRTASQRAVARAAPVEAVAHLEAAIDLLDNLADDDARKSREISLRLALGGALINAKGLASDEVEAAYLRARDLCQKSADSAGLFTALWGLCRVSYGRAEIRRARELADQVMALAQRQQDPTILLEGHHAEWSSHLFNGELATALEYCEKGNALYDRQVHGELGHLYGGHDPGSCCRNLGGMTLWLLGFPDRAIDWNRKALDLAEELADPQTLAHAHNWGMIVPQLLGDRTTVKRRAESLNAIAEEQAFANYFAEAEIFRGWVLATNGQCAQGIELMREGLALREVGGVMYIQPYHRALLAEGYVRSGAFTEALATFDTALGETERTEERWFHAELCRGRGEVLLSRPDPDEDQAQAWFEKAMEISRAQGAKSLELRAGMSLARLLDSRSRRREAHKLLAPVYDWFTEGFDTPDLKDAKALLDELS